MLISFPFPTPKDGPADKFGLVDPFWYELCSKDKDIDSFLMSNLSLLTESQTFADGESKPNGERVLVGSVKFIRLPAQCTNKSPQAAGILEDSNLLPTKLGRFRLKLVDSDNPSIIEVWKEIPGDEIPRPPEGWDDLGAGGAFVQGRWAWGREKKSTIEGSVAQRTPFRSMENKRPPFYLMVKFGTLITCSWIAITLTVLGIFTTPLAVGRSLYHLFRIPPKFIHDPLAFCIGACVFFPMMSLASGTFKGGPAGSTILQRIRRWKSRARLPPAYKFFVFVQSMILWLCLAPLTLGFSYEIAVVKSARWFVGQEEIVDLPTIALSWTVGLVVLNSWACFAYFSVFTKDFWSNIGNGILEPPPEENGAAEPIREIRNDGAGPVIVGEERLERAGQTLRGWQGKDGRIAKFFGVWRSVLIEWEWDCVDRVVLLEEFAYPVSKQVGSALVGSFLSFHLSIMIVVMIFRLDESGVSCKYASVA